VLIIKREITTEPQKPGNLAGDFGGFPIYWNVTIFLQDFVVKTFSAYLG
jgi:hypothetical protein